jgi:flagellar L-ring protein precursor FlgH
MKLFSTNRLPLALALLLVPAIARPQSLWHDGTSKAMYADKRASSVGDILTIVVQETTTASKDNKSTTTKQTAVDASLQTFLYSPAGSAFLTKAGQMPALKFSGKNDFTGGGTINNSETIIARIAVRVIDVLPNQNLIIEGRRETSFSGEHQTVVLRGLVRLDDVSSANTVFSYNVADASIHIISQGNIADNQRKGWFARLWDKFGPF